MHVAQSSETRNITTCYIERFIIVIMNANIVYLEVFLKK